jgi:hypothetical protein
MRDKFVKALERVAPSVSRTTGLAPESVALLALSVGAVLVLQSTARAQPRAPVKKASSAAAAKPLSGRPALDMKSPCRRA